MDLSIDQRIAVKGNHFGTIRYIGKVPGHPGEWVGVEWDDGRRGKHDGRVGGQRLFSCRKRGTPATLVRLQKLQEALMAPISLLEAIQARYCSAAILAADQDAAVELPGAEKLVQQAADLPNLVQASAARMHVAVQVGCWVGCNTRVLCARRLMFLCRCGCDRANDTRYCWCARSQSITMDDREDHRPSASSTQMGTHRLQDEADAVAAALPNLSFLGLSHTLGGSWADIGGSLSRLPRLETLDLGGAGLLLEDGAGPRSAGSTRAPRLERLQTLNLGPTAVGVGEALALAASWLPNLQHLVLHGDGGCVSVQEGPEDLNSEAVSSCASKGGGVLDLGQPIAPFPRHDALQSLDLSHRPDAIRGWGDVLELGRALPSLKTLNLAGARLRGVLGDAGPPPSAALSNLQTLLLGDARLQTWAEVQSLDRLPSLSHLRIAGCPVWEAAGVDARALTIARLGRLVTLNGSAVGEAERKDAELWYVSLVKGAPSLWYARI